VPLISEYLSDVWADRVFGHMYPFNYKVSKSWFKRSFGLVEVLASRSFDLVKVCFVEV